MNEEYNNMRCQKIKKILPAYLDGQAGDKEIVSRHLETCQSCGQEVKELSALSFLLKQENEMVQASPYFWNKLEQAIIQSELERKPLDIIREWINRTLVPAGATAVIIIGLLIGTNLGAAIYANIAHILNPDNSPVVQNEIDQALQLNALNDFPKESIGDIYNGLLAQNNLTK
jgi:predicted anti-sigma-YlaC factor YlaD